MPIPTPKRPSGHRLGAADALIQLEAFVDIQCPHSAQAWPTLRALVEQYKPEDLSLTVQLMALADHRQCWEISKAILYLAAEKKLDFFAALDFFYAQQSSFSNKAFYHKSYADLLELVDEKVAALIGTVPPTLCPALESAEVYHLARTPSRYAAIRGVWSTPSFFINNARQLDINHASDLRTWRALIDPLLD